MSKNIVTIEIPAGRGYTALRVRCKTHPRGRGRDPVGIGFALLLSVVERLRGNGRPLDDGEYLDVGLFRRDLPPGHCEMVPLTHLGLQKLPPPLYRRLAWAVLECQQK